jgi:hypothetical protein
MFRLLKSIFAKDDGRRPLSAEHRALLSNFMRARGMPVYDETAPNANPTRARDTINLKFIIQTFVGCGFGIATEQQPTLQLPANLDMCMSAAGAVGKGLRQILGPQLLVGDAYTEFFYDIHESAAVSASEYPRLAAEYSSMQEIMQRTPTVGERLVEIEVHTRDAIRDNDEAAMERALKAIATLFLSKTSTVSLVQLFAKLGPTLKVT